MLKSYIPYPQLFSHFAQFCYRYDLFFILASTWIQTFQPINTSFFQKKSPTYLNKPLQIEQKCLSTSLKSYLQVNAFLDLVVVEQEK